MGRNATGVIGMRLDNDGEDAIVGMIAINHEDRETILVVSEQGYGKRSQVADYRVTGRGGKGVKTLNVTEKTGKVISLRVVIDDIDLMIINKSGITIRMRVDDIRVTGRATQGVRVINLSKRNDTISSVCAVSRSEEEDTQEVPENDADAQQPVQTEAPQEQNNNEENV